MLRKASSSSRRTLRNGFGVEVNRLVYIFIMEQGYADRLLTTVEGVRLWTATFRWKHRQVVLELTTYTIVWKIVLFCGFIQASCDAVSPTADSPHFKTPKLSYAKSPFRSPSSRENYYDRSVDLALIFTSAILWSSNFFSNQPPLPSPSHIHIHSPPQLPTLSLSFQGSFQVERHHALLENVCSHLQGTHPKMSRELIT